jgi:hypothetical protein
VRQLPDRVAIFGDVSAHTNGFIKVGNAPVPLIKKMHEKYLVRIDAAIAALQTR